MRAVESAAAAVARSRRPGVPLRAATDVADPKRGTFVALGFPLLAAALLVPWLLRHGLETDLSAAGIVGLVGVAAAAERIAIQIGPRSWYTPSTPAIVLAGVLGGPLVGVGAAIAGQVGATGHVWRRRSTEAGLGSIQGILAAFAGTAAWSGPRGAVAVAAAAMTIAVVVNTLGRALIIVERRTAPFRAVWVRGIVVDVVDALVAMPILAALLLIAPSGILLVVWVLAALLAALAIAQRMRESTTAALAAEQANARRDALTGAPNRRAFQEVLVSEHARVVRGDVPAGLFVVDLDGFKSINDRYGHAIGDEILIAVVDRLTEGLRTSDVVARWGGEEITVLAPGIRSRRGLEQFAERIRKLVGGAPLAAGETAVPVTVSVGGTLLDGSQQPEEAMRVADGAMYDAKRSRDASVVAMPPRLALRLELGV